MELLRAERAGPLLLPAAQFRFGGGQIAKPVLPFRFQAAGHESILGVHGSVAAFGAFGFVARTFHLQTPLRQSGVVVGLELFDSEPHRLHGGRCDRFEKGMGHGLLDRQTADVEAVYAASIDQIFAGAVVAGSRVPAAIVSVQPPAAMATSGEALQQGRPLSHRAPRLMGLRPGVGVEPRLIGLEGCPIDEAGMMVWDEDGPLLHGQMPNPFPDGAVFIDVAFVPGLTVGVSASIHRIGEDVVECGVSGSDPADRTRYDRRA